MLSAQLVKTFYYYGQPFVFKPCVVGTLAGCLAVVGCSVGALVGDTAGLPATQATYRRNGHRDVAHVVDIAAHVLMTEVHAHRGEVLWRCHDHCVHSVWVNKSKDDSDCAARQNKV